MLLHLILTGLNIKCNSILNLITSIHFLFTYSLSFSGFGLLQTFTITLRHYKEDFPQQRTITAKLGAVQYKCIEY